MLAVDRHEDNINFSIVLSEKAGRLLAFQGEKGVQCRFFRKRTITGTLGGFSHYLIVFAII